MRTKEIEVWVRKEIFEAKENGAFKDLVCLTYPQDAERNCLKARLVIELPERKIEITESQLANAIFDSGYSGDKDNWEQLVKELFGEEK